MQAKATILNLNGIIIHTIPAIQTSRTATHRLTVVESFGQQCRLVVWRLWPSSGTTRQIGGKNCGEVLSICARTEGSRVRRAERQCHAGRIAPWCDVRGPPKLFAEPLARGRRRAAGRSVVVEFKEADAEALLCRYPAFSVVWSDLRRQLLAHYHERRSRAWEGMAIGGRSGCAICAGRVYRASSRFFGSTCRRRPVRRSAAAWLEGANQRYVRRVVTSIHGQVRSSRSAIDR